MKQLFLCGILLFLSCTKTDETYCTLEARAGLNVTVKDAVTNELLGEGITVKATDGNYTETLELYNFNGPVFLGAWEREGNYTISVTGSGYVPYVSEMVTVTSDECHVIPQQLEIILQPE